MSREKRKRKAQMKRHQAERAAQAEKRFDEARAFHANALERARFRAELNASDIPEGVKTLVGALVDPIGFVHDMARKQATR